MHGADGINMALAEVTLAETLKSAGYRTALFGKWHLGAHRDFGPMKQGFDEFFGIRDGFIDNYNHFFLHGNGFHDLYEGTREVWARDKYFPELMVQRALKFLDEHHERNFFLYIPFNIPHYPEQALKRFSKQHEALPEPRRSYAKVVATTDHYIGQVLSKLKALNLREKTVVIFMSDNGHSEETNHIRVDDHKSGYPKGHKYGANGGGGNTGKWIGRKGTFLEGGVRVPAIVSFPPKLPQGVVRDQAITAMDWYPTVLALCDVQTPNVKLDGKNLLPVIQSAEAPSPHDVLHFQWQNQWAVRDGDWKLIGRKGRKANSKETVTLHSLTDEQPEVTNYAQKKPEIVARLRQLHEDWARDVVAE